MQRRWSARFKISPNELHRNGIKVVSYENFLTPEIIALMQGPYGLNTEGYSEPNAAFVRWNVERFTSITLPDTAPAEAAKIFRVAQGAMAYGLFFYPLYTLGLDH